jgi:hypothetical protein
VSLLAGHRPKGGPAVQTLLRPCSSNLVNRSLDGNTIDTPSEFTSLHEGFPRPHHRISVIVALIGFAMPLIIGGVVHSLAAGPGAKHRVFEIRTYTTESGKLPDLLKRFREHTCQLFEKHGMTNIGYWVPTDEPRSQNTLIYILAHNSRDAAKQSWKDFQADSDWIKVKEASEANGKIVTKVESVFAEPTDFSALQ